MEVTICVGSSCHLKGSRLIVERLQSLIADGGYGDVVELRGAFCMGRCTCGVCVQVEGENFSLRPENTDAFFRGEIVRRLGARA